MPETHVDTVPNSKEVALQTETLSDDELRVFGTFRESYVPYLAATLYVAIEHTRAMMFADGSMTRAIDGFWQLFDRNTGNGTIVGLGYMGTDLLLLLAEHVGKKLGKKRIDPTIRFLSSLTIGVTFATWQETTEIFGRNTVDIPGDLFGVALGAAFILTGKIAGEKVTYGKLNELEDTMKELIPTIIPKLEAFSRELDKRLDFFGLNEEQNETKQNNKKDVARLADELADEFAEMLTSIPAQSTVETPPQ